MPNHAGQLLVLILGFPSNFGTTVVNPHLINNEILYNILGYHCTLFAFHDVSKPVYGTLKYYPMVFKMQHIPIKWILLISRAENNYTYHTIVEI